MKALITLSLPIPKAPVILATDAAEEEAAVAGTAVVAALEVEAAAEDHKAMAADEVETRIRVEAAETPGNLDAVLKVPRAMAHVLPVESAEIAGRHSKA